MFYLTYYLIPTNENINHVKTAKQSNPNMKPEFCQISPEIKRKKKHFNWLNCNNSTPRISRKHIIHTTTHEKGCNFKKIKRRRFGRTPKVDAEILENE